VTTVPEAGWAGLKNGEVLLLAAKKCAVFVAMDQRLARDRRLPRGLALIALRARSSRIESLRPLVPRVLEALEGIRPAEVIRIEE
jgi:hypothetical protein